MAAPQPEPADNGPMLRGGSRPVPDPTTLTNELVSRAVDGLGELLNTRIGGAVKVIETRLDGMDKAIEVLARWRDTLPVELKNEVQHLRDLLKETIDKLHDVTAEQFSRIDTQFVERDKRTDQLSIADKTAIAAALQAQKEAAGAIQESNTVALLKMENNFAKLLDQQATLLSVTTKSLAENIRDLKEKQDRGEGRTSVSDPAITAGLEKLTAMIVDVTKSRDHQTGKSEGIGAVWGVMLGAGGFVFGLVGMIFVIIKFGA